MAVSANYLSYVMDQLSTLGTVRSRRMFGGIGLYCDDLFFALIDDDVLYFKVDDSNRADYVSRGCEAFRPVADDPDTVSMNYYRIPEDVLEHSDEARHWAQKSVLIAAAAASAKAARRTTPRAGRVPRSKAKKRAKR
jgi:DNA transformation protein and related proteins